MKAKPFVSCVSLALVLGTTFGLGGGKGGEGNPSVEQAEVIPFLPAGEMGGGVLVPGTFYPPEGSAFARLKRTVECLEYRTHTNGLPPGAYTNWWVVFNQPQNCVAPDEGLGSDCGFFDLFMNPDAESAVFWATGSVVEDDGVGDFRARVCKGDDLGFPGIGLSRATEFDPIEGDVASGDVIGPQHLWGGLTNPENGVVWSIIKYHGPSSGDPNVLYYQTHTLLGSCFEGANGFFDGDIVQCFDPQVAVFNPQIAE